MVTHKPYLTMHSETWLVIDHPVRAASVASRPFSLWRSHPSFARRGMAFEQHSSSFIHTFIHRAYSVARRVGSLDSFEKAIRGSHFSHRLLVNV